MAINKRKILQSAQKHLQKGALDKALKDYATLLEADPKDANIRLKVGDIHLKQGKTEEAVASYLKVAERFMKDGFDSKAIALYKQVTKIDPKRYDVYVPLSELYQRLGLSSDAMKALQTAADAHYREGDKNQALDLLRKMATLDPSNTTNRLKVAELLRQEGRGEEALAEYDEVSEELERQGDSEARVGVLQKILDLDPSRRAVFVELGSALAEQKRWGQAEATAETMIDAFPGDAEGYELLAGIYQQSGRENELPSVYRRLAGVYKERGDEDQAREIMQRFVSTEALGGEESGEELLVTEDDLAADAAIGGDGAIGGVPDQFTDPGFIPDDSMRLGDPIHGLDQEDPDVSEVSAPSLPPLPPLEMEPSAEEEIPEPEDDPEQLLAEASVYLRYGKHDRAIESLRAILAQEPGHREALEKLGEALVATGDTANAVTAFERAAEAARDDGDEAGLESLRGKIEELDPAAAASLGAVAEPEAAEGEAFQEAAAEEDQQLEDIDIEIDSGVEAEADDEVLDPDDSIEFEIEEDSEVGEIPEAGEEAAADSTEAQEPSADSEEDESDFEEGDFSFATDEDEDQGEEEEAEDPAAGALDDATPQEQAVGGEAPAQSGGSATTPQQMIEDLEEADFYFQQGLHDEAEEVYKRILEAAPSHPQAMLRIGEIEAAREESGRAGAEPAVEPAPVMAEAEAPAGRADPEQTIADFEALADPPMAGGPEPAESVAEFEAAVEESMPDQPEPEERAAEFEAPVEEPEPDGPDSQQSGEADFGIDLPAPELPDLEDVGELDLDGDPEEETAEDLSPVVEEPTEPQAESTLPLAGATSEGVDSDGEATDGAGDFDLAAELVGAMDGQDSGRFSPAVGGTTEEEGFEQVFAAFKEGVEKELGEGDIEAHYDLGIAYKEMGLLEDAIGEFQIALGSPVRKLASLHAMGLCALDLNRFSDAVSHLEQALASPEIPAEQQVALRFDLGRAYQQQGDLGRARGAFEAVAAVDPDFGEVGERIAELDRSEGEDGFAALAAEQSEEAFESFDEFIEGVEAPTESEGYESFDDFMSGDDDEEDDEVGEPEPPEAEFEAEPVDDPQPEVVELEAEPVDEAESESSELEMQPEPETEELEAEAESFQVDPEPVDEPEELGPETVPEPEQLSPEPEAEEPEPAPKQPRRRKKISFV